MAQIYGDRWRLIDAPRLGQGGQSEVFVVVDITGEHPGQYALKRIRNLTRRERFKAEIEAVSRLSHPNIIRLVDHSALDAAADESKKPSQFLVMPVAAGGDLTTPGRLALYRNSIDSVIQIGKQIASALTAAHAANVIHRDVKPQNILFTGNGHELWTADFGICLIRDQERHTEADEVVGPREFMAPELAGGGKLDVTPAADVYSLGKVLYYALTGGTLLPRERLHEPQYKSVFAQGERFHSLQTLLMRMICTMEAGRITDMAEVTRHLEGIEQWEQQARVLPIDAMGLSALAELERNVREQERVAAEAAAQQDQQARIQAAARGGVISWLKSELTKAAAEITSRGTFKCEVCPLTNAQNERWTAQIAVADAYLEVDGLELRLERSEGTVMRRDLLQVRLCNRFGVRQNRTIRSLPSKAETSDWAVIPSYRQLSIARGQLASRQPPSAVFSGFFAKQDAVGSQRVGKQSQRLVRAVAQPSYIVRRVTRSFHPDVNQHVEFSPSDWPGATARLGPALSDAIKSFFEFLAADGSDISA